MRVNPAFRETRQKLYAKLITKADRLLASGDRDGAHPLLMYALEVRRWCTLDGAGEALLRAAVQQLGLSARAYHRILNVARALADLATSGWMQSPPHRGDPVPS